MWGGDYETVRLFTSVSRFSFHFYLFSYCFFFFLFFFFFFLFLSPTNGVFNCSNSGQPFRGLERDRKSMAKNCLRKSTITAQNFIKKTKKWLLAAAAAAATTCRSAQSSNLIFGSFDRFRKKINNFDDAQRFRFISKSQCITQIERLELSLRPTAAAAKKAASKTLLTHKPKWPNCLKQTLWCIRNLCSKCDRSNVTMRDPKMAFHHTKTHSTAIYERL